MWYVLVPNKRKSIYRYKRTCMKRTDALIAVVNFCDVNIR